MNSKIYGLLTTQYGECVKVQNSSGIEQPECWLTINNAISTNDLNNGEIAALLTIPQARILRDILDRFLIEETWDN